MTGKEKVLHALHHKSGPVPLDFGSNPVSIMHASALGKLREHYGIDKPVKIICELQMIGLIEEDDRVALGIDTDGVFGRTSLFGNDYGKGWKEWDAPWGQKVLVTPTFTTKTARDGAIYIYPQGNTSVDPSGIIPSGGYFTTPIVRQEPIIEEELNPDDNLEEFPILSEDDLEYIEAAVNRIENTDRYIVAALTGDTGLGDIARVPGSMLLHPKGIRDEREWYISTVTRRDYLHAVFAEQTRRALINLEKIHQRVGSKIDMLFLCGTDFGTQTSLFCSPKTYKELYMPYYQQVNNWIHAHTDWMTFKHSCGAIRPLMELIIESGFDAINPVQCSAKGMEAEGLKRDFGDAITFWGGGVDTQHTLPFGTPAEVREEVLQRCEILSANGGLVFNAIHNIQANTPVENIVAMIDAVHEFNGSKHA